MPNDWGSIAVGTRLSHFEPGFFVSWTALVGGGLRQGDHILKPAYNLPAHRAADQLARGFLKSDNDTMLMIDDDMVFEADAVERLRANAANWPYDMVMAFCTTRGIPPQPVILQVVDEQPELPYSLQGELFERVFEFEDGAVIPVGTVGLAFTLIRRRVLEAMVSEHGLDYSYFFQYGPGTETEDIPFSRNARGLGFSLAIDTAVKIRHISKITLGYEQFLSAYKDGKAADDRAQAEISGR